MAVIGDKLLMPEAGWTRHQIEDIPNIILSNTTSTPTTGSGNEGGITYAFTNATSKATFKFYGGGILIRAYLNGSGGSFNIKIDGVTDTFIISKNNTYYGVAYIKDNLPLKEHEVEITANNTIAKWIDTIDFTNIPKFKRIILKNPQTNQHYSLAEKTLIPLPDASNETMILHGFEAGVEVKLDEDFDKIISISNDGLLTENTVSPFSVYDYISEKPAFILYSESNDELMLKTQTESFSAYDYVSDTPELIVYSESTDKLSITTTVEPFKVYDHISESPQAVIYTESTDDIKISTTTEPFDLYDEFGEEINLLYYTDDEAVTEADLVIDANWSPVDELEGDFEVVTWTDESQETAQRVLEMTAIPKPQFIKLVNPKNLYGYLDAVIANDISDSYRDEARYFISDTSNSTWYVWDKKTQAFVISNATTNDLILKNGMKYTDLNNITDKQWRTWNKDYLNIGVFLKDNPRDTIVSVVDNISYKDYLPRNSTTVENTSLYILNTTARIDLEMIGNTLTGVLSDDDLTRVKYRVSLNGEFYFPANGEFTALGDSPRNISLSISSNDVIVDDWNTIKVEFQDFFGTVDYWTNTFIGTYSGLMFKDVYGEYYSNEIGEVLQYLDFGVITAGQTTVEHEVLLKNQYGYDIKNIYLYANTENFGEGMSLEFSESIAPFISSDNLKLSRVLANNDELSFFIRIKTTLGATPNANGVFNITVRADEA